MPIFSLCVAQFSLHFQAWREPFLRLSIHVSMSEVEIQVDDMALAADIVQDLCTYFQVHNVILRLRSGFTYIYITHHAAND